MFLVSCICFNKCLYSYYMAGYLLDRPRTHNIYRLCHSPEANKLSNIPDMIVLCFNADELHYALLSISYPKFHTALQLSYGGTNAWRWVPPWVPLWLPYSYLAAVWICCCQPSMGLILVLVSSLDWAPSTTLIPNMLFNQTLFVTPQNMTHGISCFEFPWLPLDCFQCILIDVWPQNGFTFEEPNSLFYVLQWVQHSGFPHPKKTVTPAGD